MKATLLLFACALIALSAAPENQAQSKAEAWLSLVDTAQYGQTWTEASSYFRARIDEPKWAQMAGGVRGPLGAKVSRKLKSLTFAKTLPGAPDGHYAVILFDSSFANKASAIETITMMDDGGEWRMAGYFIR